MKLFLALVGFVAVLKVAMLVGAFISVLREVTPDLGSEISILVTLALLLGSATHYAHRGTIIPPRPHLWVVGSALVAPILALGLAGPGLRATWSPGQLFFESALVLFQVTGLWMIGGALFGGPFAPPDAPLVHPRRGRD